jgi:NodT family efflux transporter outer membrane factor (OMF) lipoprotein
MRLVAPGPEAPGSVRRSRAAAVLLLALASLSACAVGPDYRAPDPVRLGVPGAYPNAPLAGAEDYASWWTLFDDPLLTSLVERSAAGDLDIAASAERLAQARETLVQAKAAFLPTVTANAGAQRYDLSNYGLIDASSASLSVSWTIDLFGALRRGREASAASLAAAGFDLASVRTAAAAQTASDYVAYRLARARLAIARDTLKSQTDNAEIAAFRARAGLVSALDVEQAETERAQTAASLPPLEAAATQAEASLAVLLGVAPGSLERELSVAAGLPEAPAAAALGAPLDLLRRRPDVRAAERSLAAATAMIGVAKAQLLPQLTLSGQVSSPSALTGAVGMVGDGAISSIAGSLAQTLFAGGALASKVRSQESAARGALISYRAAVLKALQDVADAEAALVSARGRTAALGAALKAAESAAILARSQYQSGLIDFQTLLSTEQALLTARDGHIQARADAASAMIQLYLALGGGWRADAPTLAADASTQGIKTHG